MLQWQNCNVDAEIMRGIVAADRPQIANSREFAPILALLQQLPRPGAMYQSDADAAWREVVEKTAPSPLS